MGPFPYQFQEVHDVLRCLAAHQCHDNWLAIDVRLFLSCTWEYYIMPAESHQCFLESNLCRITTQVLGLWDAFGASERSWQRPEPKLIQNHNSQTHLHAAQVDLIAATDHSLASLKFILGNRAQLRPKRHSQQSYFCHCARSHPRFIVAL